MQKSSLVELDDEKEESVSGTPMNTHSSPTQLSFNKIETIEIELDQNV